MKLANATPHPDPLPFRRGEGKPLTVRRHTNAPAGHPSGAHGTGVGSLPMKIVGHATRRHPGGLAKARSVWSAPAPAGAFPVRHSADSRRRTLPPCGTDARAKAPSGSRAQIADARPWNLSPHRMRGEGQGENYPKHWRMEPLNPPKAPNIQHSAFNLERFQRLSWVRSLDVERWKLNVECFSGVHGEECLQAGYRLPDRQKSAALEPRPPAR